VAFTNRAYSVLVTSVASIQNGSTYTRWMGRASSIGCVPPCARPRGSIAPMENSPPGIHTMRGGACPGAVALAGTVAANAGSSAVRAASRAEMGAGSITLAVRSVQAASAATVSRPTAQSGPRSDVAGGCASRSPRAPLMSRQPSNAVASRSIGLWS
jgi:hypothetical protein